MLMRRLMVAASLLVLGFGVTGVAESVPAGAAVPAGAVSGGFTCTGTSGSSQLIPAGVYASITMPPASSCFTVGAVTVTGPVTLQHASGLGVYSGSLTVDGSVNVGAEAAFGALANGIPITLNGALFVQSDGYAYLSTGSVNGPVLATAASGIYLSSLRVSGSVTVVGGGGDNPGEDALGNLDYRAVILQSDVISGPVTEIGYAGKGATNGFGSIVLGNQSGPMTFIGNTVAPIVLQSNVVHGPATCLGNNPLPVDGGSNSVAGPILGSQGTQCFG